MAADDGKADPVSARKFRPGELGGYTQHRLGDGGQGVVYAVPTPPAGMAGPLAYKQYKQGMLRDPAVLEAMAEFLDTLPQSERDFLAPRLAWPLAVSTRGSTADDGFLMQQIPDPFFLASSSLGDRRPQGLEFLLNGTVYLQKIGLQVDQRQLLLLLADLAEIVSRLHDHGVVVGDLSPKNVLFALGSQPRCLLIDCDSMRFKGQDALDQVETPGWYVPEQEKATPESDAFKFGLIAVRLLNSDQNDSDPRALAAVSPELGLLGERSQQDDPHQRPSVQAWIAALQQALRQQPQRQRATSGQTATQQTVWAGTPDGRPTVTIPQQNPQYAAQGTQGAPFGAYQAVPPQQAQQPVAAAGVTTGPPSRGGRLVATVLALMLVVVGLGVGAEHVLAPSASAAGSTSPSLGGSTGGGTGSAAAAPIVTPTTQTTPPAASPTNTPAAVDYSQVADNPEASAVAAMFANFYGAVDHGQYDTALTYYDPGTAVLDLGSTSSRNTWKHNMSTTQDSDFSISALTDSAPYTLATMNFTSHQQPGYGPYSAPDETCTDWSITYYLTDTDGRYRIFKAPSSGVSDSGC